VLGGASAKNFRVGPLYPRPLEELIGRIDCPIHAVYGEACHTQPVPDVREFRNCLERHGKSFMARRRGPSTSSGLRRIEPWRHGGDSRPSFETAASRPPQDEG
jgi:hypothetical protein